ncbi:MAG: hypothetical protein AAF846_01195 [Chloroflexota bacterium]
MQIRKIITTSIIAGILAIGAISVGAQENEGQGFRGRGFGQSELVQEYTGLTVEELMQALRDGSTIAELIEANGESVDAFVAEAMASAEEAFVERINEPFDFERGSRLGNLFGDAELAETFTGLTTEEIREAIADGNTLAELIEANGESVDAFVAEAVAVYEARLDEAVAEERITQEVADERLAQFEETLTQGLEEGFNFGDRDNRDRGQRGGRG